ncbi:hypothetical protein LK533_14875 [Sphingomonas sp. PL-96]|uniref:alpha/beta hydrolase n=1 Tax=Sphingomonas sp. PL-96 TaxID=2887201 RepID=UPI001E327A9B|nr:alpha/beta hydrolase-fold protein [Sphingomonas sp. PL-96]MCC2977952.1 hypothetical protein [Sphingomonas sp. PL-96]
MKPVLGLALLLSGLAASPAGAEPWQLARSDVQTVVAADGHRYRVLVAWPDGEPPSAGWPVLWVLDGEDHFATAALTARRLARAGARSGVEPGVVVGIDSGPLGRRVLDYTPAADRYAIPAGAPAHGLAIGGGDAFLDLIETRLRPLLARRLRIDPRRQALLGHSFGGLLGLHALFTGRSFSTVVAVSPSLWFGEGLLADEERRAPPSTARLLIASGTDEAGPDGPSGVAAEALASRLRARGMHARYLPLAGQSHGTTMSAAMAPAIAISFAQAGAAQ